MNRGVRAGTRIYCAVEICANTVEVLTHKRLLWHHSPLCDVACGRGWMAEHLWVGGLKCSLCNKKHYANKNKVAAIIIINRWCSPLYNVGEIYRTQCIRMVKGWRNLYAPWLCSADVSSLGDKMLVGAAGGDRFNFSDTTVSWVSPSVDCTDGWVSSSVW